MSDFLKNIAAGLFALACVVAVIGGGLYLMAHYTKWTVIAVLGGWGLRFLHAWGKELRWTWRQP
jgi:hypothetical protein